MPPSVALVLVAPSVDAGCGTFLSLQLMGPACNDLQHLLLLVRKACSNHLASFPRNQRFLQQKFMQQSAARVHMQQKLLCTILQPCTPGVAHMRLSTFVHKCSGVNV